MQSSRSTRKSKASTEQEELELLRQLEAKLRESVEFTIKREEKWPPYLRTKSTGYWVKIFKPLDEFRAGKAAKPAASVSNGQADGPTDRRQLMRSNKMAKLVITPEIEAHTQKAVAAAIKAERKRVADGIKALALPEGTTARNAAAIKKAVKEAVAAE